MIFTRTRLEGALLIDIERREDERGFFARTWCRKELAARELDSELAQESVSYNRSRGTVRGLHFQRAPHEETKNVRCTGGAVFDVIVDLRPNSSSYLQWQGFELTPETNARSIYRRVLLTVFKPCQSIARSPIRSPYSTPLTPQAVIAMTTLPLVLYGHSRLA